MTKFDINIQRGRVVDLASEIKQALLSDEMPSDQLLSQLEKVVRVHTVYSQIVSVLMLLEQLDILPRLGEAIERVVDELESEDSVYMLPNEKAVYLNRLGASLGKMHDMVQVLSVTKETAGNLMASLKEFMRVVESGEDSIDAFDAFKKLSSKKRKQAISLLEEVLKHV